VQSLVQSRNADAMERLSGAVARTAMVAGEPILEPRLVQPGQAGFMAAVIEPGMRAVAVPISARSGAGGFILPNDRVDILLTLSANEISPRAMWWRMCASSPSTRATPNRAKALWWAPRRRWS